MSRDDKGTPTNVVPKEADGKNVPRVFNVTSGVNGRKNSKEFPNEIGVSDNALPERKPPTGNTTGNRPKIDLKAHRASTSPGGRSPGTNAIQQTSVSKTSKGPKEVCKSKSDSQILKNDMIQITIKSTISSFKSFKLAVKKTTTIRVLRNYIQSRLGGNHQISLIYNNCELKSEMGSLIGSGVSNGSVIYLLVKPVAGNNDREELASLIRMSQSLANLRNLIKSMPAIGSAEQAASGSREYVDSGLNVNKEKEHSKMRERMNLLKNRRQAKKVGGSAESTSQTSSSSNSEMTKSASDNRSNEATKANQTTTTPNTQPLLDLHNLSNEKLDEKELSLFFDPPETKIEKKVIGEELFEPPTSGMELQKVIAEIKKKRCGFCRIKLQPADQEMHCLCESVFCSEHRNPQIHRCSVDMKTVDRVHIKRILPKLAQEAPRSKQL